MANLMQASSQWANRPADERFWSLGELEDKLMREIPFVQSVPVVREQLRVINEGDEISLVTPKKNLQFNNWSFGQLCSSCGAPASYMRTLPTDLAVLNLNTSLSTRNNESEEETSDYSILYRDTEKPIVRSLTTTSYNRIWDLGILHALKPALDLGWRVPPARPYPGGSDDPRARRATAADVLPNQSDFGLSINIGDMIAPAGVYAGDRDMFLFLVNPARIIDDGGQGLMRGVFIRNSEVGGGAFRFCFFYMENVCGNHIVWGAKTVANIKIVHRGRNAITFDRKMQNNLIDFSRSSDSYESNMIAKTKSYILGTSKDECVDYLFGIRSIGMSKGDISNCYDMAERWEHTAKAPPTSAWGFVHGLTRYSQTKPYADARHKLDEAGGKIIDIVMKSR